MSDPLVLRDSALIYVRDDEMVALNLITRRRKGFRVEPEVVSVVQSIANGVSSLPELREKHGSIVEEVAEVLLSEDLLQKQSVQLYEATMSKKSFARHERHLRLFNELDHDHVFGAHLPDVMEWLPRIRQAHISIIGAGAVGQSVVQHLCGIGVENFTIIDPDVVTVSNLTRQYLCSESNVGRLKADVVAVAIKERVEKSRTIVHTSTISNAGEVADLTQGSDFVVCCADHPSTGEVAAWVTDACLDVGMPHYLGGGYSYSTVTFGITVIPGRTPCWYCFTKSLQHPLVPEDAKIIKPLQAITGSLGAFASMPASLIAWDVIRTTIGADPMLGSHMGEFDFIAGSLNWKDFEAVEGCRCQSSSKDLEVNANAP